MHWILEIEAPKEILRLCVPKGSITVDGISLTINEVTDRSFLVAIIPHTANSHHPWPETGGRSPQFGIGPDRQNVERLLQERGVLPPKPSPVIDKDYL